MPTVERIRQFEKALISLGAEPEILAERGEEIEDVVPPEHAISADLQDLLAPPPTARAAVGPGPEAAAPDAELDQLDLGAFGLSDDTPVSEAEPAAEAEEEFNLPEGLFETAGESQEPAQETAEPEGPGAEPAFELPEETPAAEEPVFDLPDESAAEEPAFDLPDQTAAEEPVFDLPDQTAAEEPVFDLPDQTAAEEPAFDLPDQTAAEEPVFDLPDQTAAEEPVFDLPDQTAAEEPAFDDLAGQELPLSDLDDIGMPESSDQPDTTADAQAEALEEISLDETGPPEATAADEEQFSLPEGADAGEPGAAAGGQAQDDDFVLDTFELPGTSEAEVSEDAAPPAAGEPPAAGMEPAAAAYQGEGAKAEYTEKEFEAIRQALASLPLNLRLAVEDQIGGRTLGGDGLRRMIDLLIDGAPAVDIARLLAQSGVRVTLRRSLEKGTGLAFERTRGSLGYLLRKAVFPALQVLVPVAGLLVGLAFGANEMIVKPLQARGSYQDAVAQINAGQYQAAAESFNNATLKHPLLPWFYKAADAYRAKGQFDRAADIYERLLTKRTLLGEDPQKVSVQVRVADSDKRRRMGLKLPDRKAVLAFAHMRTYDTLEFDKAEALLKDYLSKPAGLGDYGALLALGDAYIEWGSEQPAKYQEAAAAYRRAMREQKQPNDEPIMRILRYYARTGDVAQTEAIVNGFEAKKKPKIDPQIYAEAAGALIDGGRYAIARKALGRAYDTDPKIPETAYQFARLFRWTDDATNEERALNMALELFDAKPNLSQRHRQQAILARNSLGELFYRRGEQVKAQANYGMAIEVLERELGQKRIKPNPELGRVYVNSADVHYYYDRDLNAALALYRKAQGLGVNGEDVLYKIGYIHYDQANMQPALVQLHQVAQKKRDNPSALYALGNALYLRGDYLAAEGTYNTLIRQLEAQRLRIPVLQPQENAQHRELLDLTMRAFNNLGVTEKRISQDSRTSGREARANFYLQRSIEFFDALTRSTNNQVRSEARNLGFINSRTIMYPQAGMELEIYREIPKDLDNARF